MKLMPFLSSLLYYSVGILCILTVLDGLPHLCGIEQMILSIHLALSYLDRAMASQPMLYYIFDRPILCAKSTSVLCCISVYMISALMKVECLHSYVDTWVPT